MQQNPGTAPEGNVSRLCAAVHAALTADRSAAMAHTEATDPRISSTSGPFPIATR